MDVLPSSKFQTKRPFLPLHILSLARLDRLDIQNRRDDLQMLHTMCHLDHIHKKLPRCQRQVIQDTRAPPLLVTALPSVEICPHLHPRNSSRLNILSRSLCREALLRR